MVKDVLKAIGISANKKDLKAEKTPNATTISAIKDAHNGKVTKLESSDGFFNNI